MKLKKLVFDLRLARLFARSLVPLALRSETGKHREREVIFCINSGRCGSYYLYRLLDTANNVTAFHEPFPDMAGRRLPLFPARHSTFFNNFFNYFVRAVKYSKVEAIRTTLQSFPAGHMYAETNHMFILSFYDVIMEYFENPTIIFLRRYLPSVLKSFLELDYFASHPQTPFFYTSANSPSAAVPAAAPDSAMDPVEQSIAYLIDVEGRGQLFKNQYSGTKVLDVRLEELNRCENVERLFSQLRAEPTEQTHELLRNGGSRNEKSNQKVHQVSEDYCRERIFRYQEKCQTRGISLPELPQMIKV